MLLAVGQRTRDDVAVGFLTTVDSVDEVTVEETEGEDGLALDEVEDVVRDTELEDREVEDLLVVEGDDGVVDVELEETGVVDLVVELEMVDEGVELVEAEVEDTEVDDTGVVDFTVLDEMDEENEVADEEDELEPELIGVPRW